MKQRIEYYTKPFIKTVSAIFGNFTQMNEELQRAVKTGVEHPGDNKRLGEIENFEYVYPQDGNEGGFRPSYARVNFICQNRENLSTSLLMLEDKSHHKVISPVNDGHDRKGTPLHPIAMRALLEQAIENDSYGIQPERPSPLSGKHEARNSIAFFLAYKDKNHHEHRYENLAGSIIHGSKGILEQAIMDFPNEECRIDIDDFRNQNKF
jgi:hypothetical protein